MGRIYFITYGNEKYYDSLNRIRREAERLNLFDEVIAYTDRQLPEPFRTYARTYPRGGGYWLWKPWIVWHTLEKAEEGDIIVYADAGCTLLESSDWATYFNRLRTNDYVFFVAEGKSRKWCKKEIFHVFTPRCSAWKWGNQIQATFFIVKKNQGNPLIKRWYETAVSHPDYFADLPEELRNEEDPCFKEHRHDQSILTACVCLSGRDRGKHKVCLLPEKMERRYAGGQAVLASRISAGEMRGVQANAVPKTFWAGLASLAGKWIQCVTTRCLFWWTCLMNG